ncbi:uncharacterized protein GGS22DRAFT_150930 [Annulohypoxylon maeteangense]|uniref:uncharacterized protein n=1 Tax=Annulohypoxylon maeteangense TaxID=1927788 RepID=UPI0020085A5F|nr:uncharacterized protein GGS22DRAFT_150930 [Annulohypoxylon maeteangense]KAI0890449.1 hypothetical protein GGS22DRAFT_150930 [Annulohypoxylon maeteangense]
MKRLVINKDRTFFAFSFSSLCVLFRVWEFGCNFPNYAHTPGVNLIQFSMLMFPYTLVFLACRS